MSKLYITAPTCYVNDQPSIGLAHRDGLRPEGHAYTVSLADVLARYRWTLGDKVSGA